MTTTATTATTDMEAELTLWREAGEALWPFIQYWGLCGAHPAAIRVMLDIAILLNKHPAGAEQMTQILEAAAGQSADVAAHVSQRIVSHVKQSPLMRAMVSTTRDKLFRELEALISDPAALLDHAPSRENPQDPSH